MKMKHVYSGKHRARPHPGIGSYNKKDWISSTGDVGMWGRVRNSKPCLFANLKPSCKHRIYIKTCRAALSIED